jgi:hypothetical protein
VRETGHKVESVFNTVGIIQDRLKAGERPGSRAVTAHHDVADGEIRIARGDDLADRPPTMVAPTSTDPGSDTEPLI